MNPRAIHLYVTMSWWSSAVPSTAAVMPSTPSSTPRRAVLGELSCCSVMMKHSDATRYEKFSQTLMTSWLPAWLPCS